MPVQPCDQIDQLLAAAGRMGVDLNRAGASAMHQHLMLLEQWNRRLNLTAITEPGRMLVEHVLDSLAVLPWLEGQRVLDIGSGGGFPGLPLAIASPQRQFILLDSRGKRVEFLRFVVAKLGLVNVRLANDRIEKYRPPEKFDTLVCRAFAPLAEILTLTRSLQLPGTTLLAMKGRNAEDELAALTEMSDPASCQSEVIPLTIDGLNAERHLVRIRFHAEQIDRN